MRRAFVGIWTAVIATAAVAVTAVTVAELSRAEPAGARPRALDVSVARTPAALSPAAQLRANRAAAWRDARQRLRTLRLPPSDVTSTAPIPGFARSFEMNASPRGTLYASVRRWELAKLGPAAVIAYLRRHPPAGSMPDPGSGSSSDAQTGVTSLEVEFSWPDLPGRLLNRTLTVTVVTPPHGDSVVIAQSGTAWVLPRSPGERVPAAVRAVLITLRLGPPATGPVVKPGGHVRTTTHLVWRAARVRRLVDTFNGLAIVQPSTAALACPMMLTGAQASSLTLAFKAGRDGVTLARAQVYLHPGAHGGDGAGPCNPINFWIGARRQTPLLSDTFVAAVGRLIGARIS